MTHADKKTIFITGTSSGMGKATAQYFAERDWNVIAAMRHPEQDRELAAIPNVDTVALDITDVDQIHDVVGDIVSNRRVDVVFNNAGLMLAGPMESFADQQLVDQITTNLLGPMRVTQAFIPHFRHNGDGIFINTTSLTALIPGPFMSVYSAAKAGLERWSFGLNLELNPFGIRVKTIIPGIVNTHLMNNATIVHGDAYETHIQQVLSVLGDPNGLTNVSNPSGTSAIVFEAATDGTDQIRYLTDHIAMDNVSKMVGFGEEQIQLIANRTMFG